jgi:hypothetical protein
MYSRYQIQAITIPPIDTHLHQTFRPSNQDHYLSRTKFHDVKFKRVDMESNQIFHF